MNYFWWFFYTLSFIDHLVFVRKGVWINYFHILKKDVLHHADAWDNLFVFQIIFWII